MKKRGLLKRVKSLFAILIFVFALTDPFCFAANATNNQKLVAGDLFVFGKKSEYEISSAENSTSTIGESTYGKFYLNGNVEFSSELDGIPSYKVGDGGLSMTYVYDDELLNASIDSWHLYSDDTETVDGKNMGGEIGKGVIWLQTSMDNLNWTNAVRLRNAFSSSFNGEPFYTARDIELINGCYYRVVVAYETRKRTKDSNILFINTDEFSYKKYAEVYKFYAFTDAADKEIIDYSQTYNLGTKVRVKEFDGYYGQSTIGNDDIHYGWDLGNFFVSGYTDKRFDADGNVVFLKNVGDKVTLWFNLAQNIDALNGKSDLKITSDGEGFDKYFETPTMNFGRGVLIVRYTDYNNNKSEPQIYTNYLKANTSFGADTKVQLFEEGDYEIALNYEVTKDDMFDKEGHYRIFFKFSVRNGNCMVYPFDVVTGSELTNSSMTENGFRLDLAKSRYLKINIKREVLKDSADGLVEDTRFNGPARDGAEYTEEGIYTITVSNDYTNQFTVKKIYVGTNNIMRAHMTTGLSIPEINNLVAEGATIFDDGTIKLAETIYQPEIPTDIPQDNTVEVTTPQPQPQSPTVTDEGAKSHSKILPIIIAAGIVLLTAISVVIILTKKNSGNKNSKGGDNEWQE